MERARLGPLVGLFCLYSRSLLPPIVAGTPDRSAGECWQQKREGGFIGRRETVDYEGYSHIKASGELRPGLEDGRGVDGGMQV